MFIKICGIANEEDALLSAGLGADAIGLVFAPSTRQVSRGLARDIVRRLPPEILSIGVFRNEVPSTVVEIANSIGLRGVQLHGHESPADTRWIAERVPAVIRAFGIGDSALNHLEEFGDVQVLIDSPRPGSGSTFDWSTLKRTAIGRPFILAGGLGPDNVADAIATVRPWGVDVSSGVESGPARKDAVKLQKFIARAREAFESMGPEPTPEDFESDWDVLPRPLPETQDEPDRLDLDIGRSGRARADIDLSDDEIPFDWEEDTTWH